jgi:hypothetical protein
MLRTLLLLVVVSLTSLVVNADPITTGIYSFGYTPSSGPSVFQQFSGATFSVNAYARSLIVNVPALTGCQLPCAGGSSISLSGSAFLLTSDFDFGSVIVQGVSYPISLGNGLGLASDMSFIAGSVLLPDTTDSSIVLEAPFSVSAGSNIHGPGYTVNFAYSGGIARLVLNRTGTNAQGHTTYGFERLTYAFSAQPTPEPVSVVLMLSGLVTLPWVVRKRGR